MNRYIAIWSLLSLFLVLHSCNNSNNWTEPFNNEEKSQNMDGYIKVAIHNAPNTYRALEDDPMTNIKTLSFIFFSKKDSEYKITEIKELFINNNNVKQLPPIRLPKGDYKLLCIANISPYFRELIIQGTTLEEVVNKAFLIKAYQTMTDVKDGIVNGGIMMTNVNNLAEVNENNFFLSEQEQDSTSPIVLDIESLLARVWVSSTMPSLDDTKPIKLSSLHTSYYSVTSISRSLFLLRSTTPANSTIPFPANYSKELEQEFAYSPGYWEMALNKEETELEKIRDTYRGYRNGSNLVGVGIPIGSGNIDLKNSELYVKETTVAPNKNLKSLVPHIIVAYPIYPASIQVSRDKGWVRYKNAYMNEETFCGIVDELTNNPGASPETDMPQGFIDSVKLIVNDDRVKKMNEPFSLRGIDFFYKSLNYYSWPIRHFGDDKAPESDSFGRYGIVRNNEYTIKVSHISWFGSNVIPRLSKEMTPIEEKAPISLSIQVKPIQKREQTVDF